MEFWLAKGIAGFRVDAAPYLVVQADQPYDGSAGDGKDGFSIIKEMRATVREHRSDGVLIAEADVDPEDYGAYFGDGDRFTGLLNFWLNNHLFLALARGEGEPIARALRRQPVPPGECQYAIWLRNFDELDLEQLSDAEREEAMAVLAPDPQMRAFGRGIRRRLGPMMRDVRQLKLSMFLLGVLPGTPVVLYGDEIGMGENLELPDRASVRTPMQWSEEANAGFSEAPPLDLVHPVIDTGAFGYHYVNVASETQKPESLLSTLRHLFALRAELGPFHDSTATIVEPGSPQALVLRHAVDPDVLAVANLSADRLDVQLPEEHRADWEELIADHAYDETEVADRVHLHGYGYRLFRRRG
jgi:maltose alpha-D-glucosyltransferase/alpha-amylase